MPFNVRTQVARHSGFDMWVLASQKLMQDASVFAPPPE